MLYNMCTLKLKLIVHKREHRWNVSFTILALNATLYMSAQSTMPAPQAKTTHRALQRFTSEGKQVGARLFSIPIQQRTIGWGITRSYWRNFEHILLATILCLKRLKSGRLKIDGRGRGMGVASVFVIRGYCDFVTWSLSNHD